MANPNFVDDSILGRLRDIYTSVVALLTGTILAAGTALIGKVGIDQVTANANEVVVKSITAGATRIGTVSGVVKTVSVTKVLESAAAYTIGDVLSETDTASEGTAWTFAAIFRANNTGGYITKVHAICETTNVKPRLVVFFFKATPTCELDDNAANTALLHADLANYLGKVDLPAMEDIGTGDSESMATPSTYGNLPLWVDSASDADDLIVVVATRDAFTNTAGNDLTIVISLEQY